jgi:hypothetical protein
MLEDFGHVRPWHLIVYAGVALLILSGFSVLNRAAEAGFSRPVRFANAFFIASGILALPIFVGHGLVIPAKDLLLNVGVAPGLALLVPLGAFLAGMAFAYSRLLRFLVRR